MSWAAHIAAIEILSWMKVIEVFMMENNTAASLSTFQEGFGILMDPWSFFTSKQRLQDLSQHSHFSIEEKKKGWGGSWGSGLQM